ncbi:MAG: pyridoxine 5'-phosphate synthase [Candidatus Zixiibacteriota bacterium]
MARLSVNLDHVASLREVRAARNPDPVHAAVIVEQAGADGITLHLRKDRRHIKDRDLFLIRQVISANLTLEMAPIEEMLQIAIKLKPNMVTLVPELTTELTTERGFNLVEEGESIEGYISTLREAGIAVSLFIDPDENNIKMANELVADFVELNTSRYADASSYDEEIDSLREIEKAASLGDNKGLGIAVGHGLNYKNVGNIARILPIEEFSIGHAIIARSVFTGIDKAVKEMKDEIEKVRT